MGQKKVSREVKKYLKLIKSQPIKTFEIEQ